MKKKTKIDSYIFEKFDFPQMEEMGFDAMLKKAEVKKFLAPIIMFTLN